MIPFLVKIYQNNFCIFYLYNNIFEPSTISFNFYSNSIDFLSNLFTKEQEIRINKGFKIKNGFYILNNKHLILNGSNFILHKLNEYSLIFSFKLFSSDQSAEDISLINISNKDKKEIYKIFIDKNKYFNIKIKKNEWKTDLVIEPNTNYLICISQDKKVLDLFANNIEENKNSWIEREKHSKYLHYFHNKISLPEFDKIMTFEFGKNNFIGIFGELFIINKAIREIVSKVHQESKDKKESKEKKEVKDIQHLFDLKENYADILSSNNNRYDLLYANNKFYRDNDDIKFFNQFEYQIQLAILTQKVNNFLSHKNYISIKPYGRLQYEINSNNCKANNKIEIMNLKTYSLKYSILDFLMGKGIDYLIFQLHNIISNCKNNEDINFHLFKTLKFFYEIVLLSNDYLIIKKDKKMKIKEKVTIFLLSLVSILNTKKRQIALDENIRKILFKFCEIAKDKNLFNLLNIFLSILLDSKLFESKNMSHYGDLFDIMMYLIDKFEKEREYSLFNRELFYKILSFDHILESKEMKHKKYMKMIGSCLILKDSQKNDKDIIRVKSVLVGQLLSYIQYIKNEMKLYHYLKVIYINCNNIQECLRGKNDFAVYIKIKMDKIDNNHCKYCKNIQILCYLLFYEIFVNNCNDSEDDRVFHYEPYGFMKFPNYNFIKCIFIQYFKVENEQKLHYFKSSDININEMTFFKQFYNKDQNKDKDEEAIDIITLANYSRFIPKLNSLMNYINFLYKEYNNSNNEEMMKLIENSMLLILSFIKEVFSIYTNDIIKHESNDNCNSKLITQKSKFVHDFFRSEGFRIFYIIYIHLFGDKALNILFPFIQASIYRVYNPFYLDLLAYPVSLSDNLETSHIYKSQILERVIIEIENSKNKKSVAIIQNSIIILIKIYNNIVMNKYPLSKQKIENSIILFVKFILDNNFLYSKLIFNINDLNKNNDKNNNSGNFEKDLSGLSPKNLSQSISFNEKNKKESNKKNFKFLSEIIMDIIFKLYENKESQNRTEYISLLTKYLIIQKNHTIFYHLDEVFFLDTNKNNQNTKNNTISINGGLININDLKMINDINIKTNYCQGKVISDVLHSLFFFLYFYNKKYKNTINEEYHLTSNKDIIMDLIDSLVNILFNDCVLIFQLYLKKIKKLKSKEVIMNEYFYKMYYCLVEIFIQKNKDKTFNLNGFELLYEKLLCKKEILVAKRRDSMFEEIQSGLFLERKDSINHFPSKLSSKNSFHKKKLTSSASLVKLGKEKKKNIYQRPKSVENKNINIIKENFKRLIIRLEENIINNRTNNKSTKNNSNNNSIVVANNNSIDDKTKADEVDSISKKNISVITNTQYTENSSESDKEDSASESDFLSHSINEHQYSVDANCMNNAKAISSNFVNKCNTITGINIEKLYSPFKDNINNNLSENNQSSLAPIQEDPRKKILSSTNNSRLTIRSLSSNQGETEEDERNYLETKLKEIDPPYLHYKNIFGKSELKITRMLFNPKQMFLFRTFCFTFRKYIFYNKKFKKLRNTFKISYKHVALEHSLPQEEEYALNYPTKIMNFTCKEYYRPFLKPCLNYFNHQYFNNTHPYIKKEIINKSLDEEENLHLIKFEPIILLDRKKKKKTKRVVCENISNKGSIFGYIYFNHSFMIFEDTSYKDKRLTLEPDNKKCILFLYSSDKADRLTNQNKYIIIYYDDIKEIILRRFCFTYIAYEIFLKDGKSFLFNFFHKDNLNIFNKYFNDNIEKYRKDSNMINNSSSSIDFKFIKDQKNYFDKADYKTKYARGEITNFEYLLLLNKFSSRSYNDNNQYLIFPLLYMDTNKTRMRDLSKPICLNKSVTEEDYMKYKNNYDTMGYHFNIHYATMAYVLFYLMRLVPFTYCQIKFQSGHFDAPARMFTSLANLLYVFSVSDENRELTPEIFHCYESLLNLNYNGFGFIPTDKKQINHFNTSQNIGIVEFIINSRQLLESKDLSGWINNVFGYRQYLDTQEGLNSFPDYSYEQFNDFEKMKDEYIRDEKPMTKFVKDVKSKIELISLGMTPIQLFKSPHPVRDLNKNNNKLENLEKKGISPLLRKKSVFGLLNNNLKSFINGLNEKYQFLSNDNHGSLKLIFISKLKLTVFLPYIELDKNLQQPITIDLDDNKIIKLKPVNNLFIELFTGFYCLCRYVDKTIKIFSEKNKFSINWSCIVTSIEFYSHNKTKVEPNTERHINKILIGDEEGNLSLIQIEIDYLHEKKTYLLKSINLSKLVKSHYSYINGILYNERLNIIISSCSDGFITINNAYSFDVINIIELGKDNNILDFKVSCYDLLYIHCIDAKTKDWYIFCYTLNGIKVAYLSSQKTFINYFIDNAYLYLVYPDKNIRAYNFHNLKEKSNDSSELDTIILSKKEENKVLHCSYCSKLKKIIVILNKEIITQDVPFKN